MKNYFIGLTLASSSSTDSGIAVVDRQNQIIYLDKLYTMNDIRFFFENFSSLKNSHICVSIPHDNTLINGKWRLMSKFYHQVNSNHHMLNRDNWMQRFSTRGCDFFKELKNDGIKINRFSIYMTRQEMGLISHLKDRSPADCKFLQTILKTNYGFDNLPANMIPMAQLEAIVGTILAKKIDDKKNTNPIFNFHEIDVIK
jgi:hypothetical protein